MEELDRLITRYDEIRQEISNLEKKLEKYKKKIDDEMRHNGLDNYKNSGFQVLKCTQQRLGMQKKNVPEEIWSRYATAQKVEFLMIKKHSIKSK